VDLVIVPTWVSGWRWTRLHSGKAPSKAQGRKGTRRAWKRAHPRGIRWRYGPVEPDHVLKVGGRVLCTAAQAKALRERIAA
jgi:hypothetical protein